MSEPESESNVVLASSNEGLPLVHSDSSEGLKGVDAEAELRHAFEEFVVDKISIQKLLETRELYDREYPRLVEAPLADPLGPSSVETCSVSSQTSTEWKHSTVHRRERRQHLWKKWSSHRGRRIRAKLSTRQWLLCL